jgi:hypothetical protein
VDDVAYFDIDTGETDPEGNRDFVGLTRAASLRGISRWCDLNLQLHIKLLVANLLCDFISIDHGFSAELARALASAGELPQVRNLARRDDAISSYHELVFRLGRRIMQAIETASDDRDSELFELGCADADQLDASAESSAGLDRLAAAAYEIGDTLSVSGFRGVKNWVGEP